ncbi:hypothetical protein [Kitasatospora sp. NPDC093806]|uniref:HalD/BesD family halogenase n=1 Tax=Kitasatospora sp. NPDC093806 TaxID=3155075 RepID=UPI0034125100
MRGRVPGYGRVVLSLPPYAPGLSERFRAEGYLPLPALLGPAALALLRAEVARLEKLATRRDLTMAYMDDSPRHMTTLGGHVIARHSGLIDRLYRDPSLIALVGRVAGLDAVPVREPLERYVVNILHRPGDTHGAHTDDYPLALVLFADAPAGPGDGGLLEYVPRAGSLGALDTPAARPARHRPGDAYLLRSDTTAHRVTALRRPGIRRSVVNLAYTTPGRQQAVTESAALLY